MSCVRHCVLGLCSRASAWRRIPASPWQPEPSWRIGAWLRVSEHLSTIHTSPWSAKGPPINFPELADSPKDPGNRGRALVTSEDLFEKASRHSRTRDTYERVLRAFCKQDIRRRGHVEFIYMALQKMPEFGVERELAVYNKLLDVFPKEVFVPRNYIQRMFNHFPRQQECAIQVLEQMENYGILPNTETKSLLVQIFGAKSHPMRKYQRLLYWFPRFKHASPFPVPQPLPADPVELARLSLRRIANDLSSNITVYQEPHARLEPEGYKIHLPHVVGIQSPDQRDLLAWHNPQHPVFVEGPFPLWLRRTCVHYYVLRGDPLPPEAKVLRPVDPERNFFYPLELNFDLERDLGDEDRLDVEEVDEGPVFALCQAGSGDPATLSTWISGLQLTNPSLGRTPVLFRTGPSSRQLEEAGGERRPREEEEELGGQQRQQ